MRARMRSVPTVLALLGLAASAPLVVACDGDAGVSPEEFAAVQRDLAAQQTTQQELEDRIAELEARLDQGPGRDELARIDDRLTELTTAIDEVADATVVLDAALEAERAATQTRLEDAEAAGSDLRSGLATVRDTTDALEGELEELTTLYATLRDRLDRLQRGG
jgi:chromosome segregation ATPase